MGKRAGRRKEWQRRGRWGERGWGVVDEGDGGGRVK